MIGKNWLEILNIRGELVTESEFSRKICEAEVNFLRWNK